MPDAYASGKGIVRIFTYCRSQEGIASIAGEKSQRGNANAQSQGRKPECVPNGRRSVLFITSVIQPLLGSTNRAARWNLENLGPYVRKSIQIAATSECLIQ